MRLDDLGEQRLALMDESGVDVQVLSVTTPALHNLEPEESVTLARRTNDLIAATIAKYRTRFQGFATLPTAAPKEAATELERAVTRLGFSGDHALRSHPREEPGSSRLLTTTSDRHETWRSSVCAPSDTATCRQRGLLLRFQRPDRYRIATFALGWHYEAGIQFVRLILAGVFDKYPDLQIILGHWGEVVLFYLERLNSLGRVAHLQRPIADYIRQNLYLTPSGMWSQFYLQRTLELVEPERILFSTDYPYQYRPGGPGRSFIEEAVLSPEQKELFAHGNWERLIGSNTPNLTRLNVKEKTLPIPD